MADSADGQRTALPGRRPKGRKRAEAILDAAVTLLAEEGHAALSLRNVAERAGVRLGHLQYYYPSRQSLIRAAVERALRDLAARVESVAAPGDGRPRRLATVVTALLADQANGTRIRLLTEVRGLAMRDPEIAGLLREYTTRVWQTLAGTIAAANTGLSRARIERRAAVLVALLEGLLVFRPPDRPDELPLIGLEREIVELTGPLTEP